MGSCLFSIFITDFLHNQSTKEATRAWNNFVSNAINFDNYLVVNAFFFRRMRFDYSYYSSLSSQKLLLDHNVIDVAELAHHRWYLHKRFVRFGRKVLHWRRSTACGGIVAWGSCKCSTALTLQSSSQKKWCSAACLLPCTVPAWLLHDLICLRRKGCTSAACLLQRRGNEQHGAEGTCCCRCIEYFSAALLNQCRWIKQT